MSRWLLSNSKLLLFQKHDDHGSRTSTKHIGVSKLLRNLARKWLLDRIRPCMADFFAPLQAGTALSGVCEVAVLPTRLYLEAEDRSLLYLDFTNAFNTVNRKVVMESGRGFFQDALPFVQATYAIPTQAFTAVPGWTTPSHIFL